MAFPTGWQRKCIITIPAAQISGSNSNFPILLTEANFPVEILDGGVNSALNGGGDIRLSEDSAGSILLACDIVTFITGGTPSAEVWVNLPALNSGAAKNLYVWYKKSGEVQPPVTDPYGRNTVWSGAEAVVLMESATPVDHTGNHGFGVTGSLSNIAGPFGAANSFSGSDRLSNADASLRDILPTNDTTVSIIARRSAYDGAFHAVVSWDGTDDFLIYPMDGTGAGTGLRVFWRDLGGNIVDVNGESLGNSWIHNSFTTRAANNHEAYTNGISVGTSSSTGAAGPFTSFYIGGWNTQNWDGDIAQVIVWKTARSSGWLVTAYNNQSNPPAFANAGTPQAVGGGVALTIFTGRHSQTADNIIIAQDQSLISIDGFHSVGSDNAVFSQSFGLLSGNSLHVLSSGDVTFAQLQALIIQNITHGLSSDTAGTFDPGAFISNPDRVCDAVGSGRTLSPASGDRTTQPNDNRTLRI